MRRAGLLALALGVGACAKQAGKDASAPVVSYAAPGLSLEQYEQLLAQNEVALRRQGVRVPPSGTRVALSDAPRGEQKRAEGAAPGDFDDATTEQAPEITGGAAAAPEPAPAAFPAAGSDEEAESRAPARGRGPNASSRAKEKDRAPDRCEMICELASATCDLEAKICDLAQEHSDDARYQNACERARQDCAIAQEACLGCAE